MELSKKIIAFYLVLIILVSLGLKLYLIDFSLPFNSDNLGYTLRAISHSNSDFSQMPDKGLGWSMFMTPFFYLLEPNNLVDYSNIARVISLGISSASIVVMYLVGRKFFDGKYSLVVASLFAFEPHLNYNAGFGLSEPLYHLAILASFYFTLNNNTKYIIPSLAIAGITWWIRINGFGIFIIISLIYFITQRKNLNQFKNYGLGVIVFLIIISPMLIQRNNQFGDPFYFWFNERIFTGSYEMLVSQNVQDQSISGYIEDNGFIAFIQNFVLKGVFNIADLLLKLLFPYLIILLPFGIVFSLRAFDQKNQYIKANWIFILTSLGLMIITLSIVPERRYLFFLFPFLIIFATIPIQRVIEYGSSTFSFSHNQKNIFLIMVIGLVFALSLIFTTLLYQKPDAIFENEKIEFAKFVVKNLHGKILDDSGPALEYVSYVIVSDPPSNFKNYRINQNVLQEVQLTNQMDRIFIYAESVDELISKGKSYDLKYIISNKNEGYFHQYVDEIYDNENKYPFLIKVFDSDEHGFTKLKIKVFEIDYDEFHLN